MQKKVFFLCKKIVGRIFQYGKRTELAAKMKAVVENGTREEWLYACKKNEAFVASIMDTSKLTKARL